ncbi:MAG: hypothetical protein ACTHW4_00605 [Actinomycetales bacterium]
MDRTVASTTSPRTTASSTAPTGAPSALSPDSAWMLPPDDLVADVESAFSAPSPAGVPAYGGLRYTAAWWAARPGY